MDPGYKMAHHHNAFPTLIVEEPNFISEEECNSLKKLIDYNKSYLLNHECLTNGKSSHLLSAELGSFTDNILDKTNNSIKKRILEYAKDYAVCTGYSIKNTIDSSWFNIQYQDSILKEHTHPFSTISGILFIKCDNNSSPIVFHNPNPYISIAVTKAKRQKSTFELLSFNAIPKTLLLFPSWLKHGSNNIHNLSKERIVISFNIK